MQHRFNNQMPTGPSISCSRRLCSWRLCSWRFCSWLSAVVFLVMAASTMGSSPAAAQDVPIDGWKVVVNRTFHGQDGHEIFVGNFVGMVGGRVHLLSPQGDEKKLRLDDLSEEDRNWVRGEITAQKQRDSDREKVIKIRTQLSIGNSNTIISNCKKLRAIGRNAEIVADELNRLVTNHPDDLVKMEAFITYVAVLREIPASVDSILNALNNHWKVVLGRLEKKPEDFLNEMAGFGGLAVPYLQHVAAVGLLTPPKTNEPFTQSIQALSSDDTASWRARNAAITAIGKISSEETLLLVLEHLLAAEEVEKQEKVHKQTIETCLNAIGAIHLDNDEVQSALDRHEAEFPKVVERVRGLLKK